MASAGIVGDVRGIASDALRMARTRLELLAIEVQEEKARAMRQLIVAAATLFFLSFGMLLAILWLALFLPEGPRQVVLGGLGLAFFGAGAAGLAWMRRSPNEQPFSATVATLHADERALASSGDD
jgi:uncharacterized membrane protein YqjE